MAPAFLAVIAAYNYIHSNWGLISPVVLMIEHAAENTIPGVKKFEIAVEALSPQLAELKDMTPEMKAAFNSGVKVIKLVEAAKAALAQPAATTAGAAVAVAA